MLLAMNHRLMMRSIFADGGKADGGSRFLVPKRRYDVRVLPRSIKRLPTKELHNVLNDGVMEFKQTRIPTVQKTNGRRVAEGDSRAAEMVALVLDGN